MSELLTWTLEAINFFLNNFFVAILLIWEVVFVFMKARGGEYQWYRDAAGSLAITVLILHGGWAASEVAYSPFLIGWVVPLVIACAVAAVIGIAMRKIRSV